MKIEIDNGRMVMRAENAAEQSQLRELRRKLMENAVGHEVVESYDLVVLKVPLQ